MLQLFNRIKVGLGIGDVFFHYWLQKCYYTVFTYCKKSAKDHGILVAMGSKSYNKLLLTFADTVTDNIDSSTNGDKNFDIN